MMASEFDKDILLFALYHLIFVSDDDAKKYKGHSHKDWERYKELASDDLYSQLKEILDWGLAHPDTDFRDIIMPATDISNEAILHYMKHFRESAERYT